MSLCEVNVNKIAPDGTVGSRKNTTPSVLATYVSPPRNPVTVAPAQRQKQLHPVLTTPGSALQKPAQMPQCSITQASSNARIPGIAPHPQQHMMLMAAFAAAAAVAQDGGDSCANCPCPTCAYYRAYYYYYMNANGELQCPSTLPPPLPVLPAPNSLHTAPPPPMSCARKSEEGSVLRNISAVPVMSMRTTTPEAAPATTGLTTPTNSALAPPVIASENPLEEFHQRFVGHIVDLACTSSGKSFLQSILRMQDAEAVDCIIKELCESGLNRVAIDNNGCHFLRAVVEHCSREHVAALVECLSETLILNMCTMSQYTRRTIQSLFQVHFQKGVDLQPVLTILSRNVAYLAATQQGCIALMRVYEACDDACKELIMEPLLPSFTCMAFDPYGNYVVQCAIEHSNKMVAAEHVVTRFEGYFVRMGCDKYASNVVEKVIRFCGDVPAVRRILLDELVYNPASLQEMVCDNFGNFVVQSLVEFSQQPIELKRIQDRLKPALANSPFAPKIEAKLKAQQRALGIKPNAIMDKGISNTEYHKNSALNSTGFFSIQQVNPTVDYSSAYPLPEVAANATVVSSFSSHHFHKGMGKQHRFNQYKSLPQTKGHGK